MKIKVCRRNKYGFCRYGDTCHFKHERKICNDSNCNIFNCNLRHPRICRWFQVYGRCKFTSFCKYKHTEIKSFEEIVTKIEHNDNKLADIDIILENLKKKKETSCTD